MINNKKETIGDRISKLLNEKNITQKELADKMIISEGIVSYWKNNKRTPTTEQVIALAKVLSVSTDYLLGLQTAKTQDKDLAYVCKYLGIDEQAVQEIKRLAVDERYCHLINDICIPNTENKTEFIKRKCTSKLHIVLRLVVEELFERELQISTAERIIESPRLTNKDVDKIIETHHLNGEDAERMKKALHIIVEDDMKYYNLIDEFWLSDDKIRINTFRIQETIKDFLREYYKELILKTDDLKKSIPPKQNLISSPVDNDDIT